ncbi:EscU/YscU/HrcU family type III secretion system export apparatus switch protein [Fodinicurvata sp. EGI_FJ10296]|uniref:EscU/YscU/HrcU family type III secretion system export apparatus switch protein n=1 Tax=Fodinicurvata sp. EGI_FJ10296 TaxID=3231908 RepID=UPI003452A1A8
MTRFSSGRSPADPKTGPFEPERRLAVALSYREAKSNAPRVIASGKGHLADAILDRAFANDVKVRTDPDLAEILASVDVGSEIPEEAFVAVAEILSYLYRVSPELAPGTADGGTGVEMSNDR